MKAIICEICGSNELVKDGEFFVCQYCGTRYTPESARKMFAAISGTVKIDRTSEFESLMKNAARAYGARNYPEAEALFLQALTIDADDPRARMYKVLSRARRNMEESVVVSELIDALREAVELQRSAQGETADVFAFVRECLGEFDDVMGTLYGLLDQERDRRLQEVSDAVREVQTRKGAKFSELMKVKHQGSKLCGEIEEWWQGNIDAISAAMETVAPSVFDVFECFDAADYSYWEELRRFLGMVAQRRPPSWLEGQRARVDAAYAEWRDRYLDLNGLRGEHQALQARIDVAEARATALTAERDGLSRLKRLQRKALAAQIGECRREIASLAAACEGLFRR